MQKSVSSTYSLARDIDMLCTSVGNYGFHYFLFNEVTSHVSIDLS